jgi:cardiolipin synthase A/B
MSHLNTGNQVTLLRNGAEYFPALIAAIQAAKHEIYMQTYIYEPDKTGLQVGEALMQAAKRGVFIFLLLDGFGSRKLSKSYVKTLSASGIDVMFFRPKISPWTLKRSRLRRLHSKLTVIDGKIGFVGGINVIDDDNTPSHTPPRIDYAVKVKGALLEGMHTNARLIWLRACQRQFVKARNSGLLMSDQQVHTGVMQAAFLTRDNVKHRRDIENAYLSAIKAAQAEIIIANAYFLPGLRFRHALRDAAERGVRVVLLLQQRTEYRFLDFAKRALYSALLNQGIQIYEYHKSFMHSKVAVIDSQIAIVGSSNIDPFSLFLSLESNVVVHHKRLATQLRQYLQLDIEEGAVAITVEEWHRYSYVKRLLSWLAYALVKSMIGIIGYSEKP